jgi:hypothetical protein
MIDVKSHTQIIDAFDKAIKKKILRLQHQMELAIITRDIETKLNSAQEIVHHQDVELIGYRTKSGEDRF